MTTQLLNTTPIEDGFRMPGEFEPHSKTWMLWPERHDTWRDSALPAQHAFAEVAWAISQFEPVTMGVNPGEKEHARTLLGSGVSVVTLENNDSWMRDCGPTFVIDGRGGVRGVDWIFNAWGGLYGGLYYPWDLDDAVPQKVLSREGFDRYKAPIVLEGGSIHTDGEGTLLTTEECLLNPNRNPSLSKKEIEQVLMKYLGVSKIIWLGAGTYQDETSGHVDNLCCFVEPGVVVLTWTDDKTAPQYEISLDAFHRLEKAVDARGRKLEIYKLHQPDPLTITQLEADGIEPNAGSKPRLAGDYLDASYVNFYICNEGVILPIFGDPHDQLAIELLQRLMPGHRVVGVPGREILLGGGNVHCITQQQPAGIRAAGF